MRRERSERAYRSPRKHEEGPVDLRNAEQVNEVNRPRRGGSIWQSGLNLKMAAGDTPKDVSPTCLEKKILFNLYINVYLFPI